MPYTQFAPEIGEADLPRLHVRPENFQYLPLVVFYGPRGHLIDCVGANCGDMDNERALPVIRQTVLAWRRSSGVVPPQMPWIGALA
jgi:hypothetical protein